MVGQVLIQALVWVVAVEVLLILRQHGAGAGFDQRRSRGEDCSRQRIRRLNSANTPPLRPVRWLSLSERNNASARPCSATVVRSAREKRRSGVTITVPALTLQVAATRPSTRTTRAGDRQAAVGRPCSAWPGAGRAVDRPTHAQPAPGPHRRAARHVSPCGSAARRAGA